MKNNIIKGLIVLFSFVISFSITYTVKKLVNKEEIVVEAGGGGGSGNKDNLKRPIGHFDDNKVDLANAGIQVSEAGDSVEIPSMDSVAIADNAAAIGDAFVAEEGTVEEPIINYNSNRVQKLDVTIGKPKQDYKTMAYNFTVSINNLPEQAVATFTVSNKNIVVAQNNDGQFKAIPSNDNGRYQLEIKWKDSKGNPRFGIDTLITGFKHFEKPKMPKLEASELEKRINRRDNKLLGKNISLSSNLRLFFTNIREEEKCPETIDEIYNKFKFGKWSSINVVSVDYNDSNQATMITISINHSEE